MDKARPRSRIPEDCVGCIGKNSQVDHFPSSKRQQSKHDHGNPVAKCNSLSSSDSNTKETEMIVWCKKCQNGGVKTSHSTLPKSHIRPYLILLVHTTGEACFWNTPPRRVGWGWGGWGAMLTFTITFGNQGWHISTQGGVGVGWVGSDVDVHYNIWKPRMAHLHAGLGGVGVGWVGCDVEVHYNIWKPRMAHLHAGWGGVGVGGVRCWRSL